MSADVDLKACPECLEDIPAMAQKCSHCGHDFTMRPFLTITGGLILGLICAYLLFVWATEHLWHL